MSIKTIVSQAIKASLENDTTAVEIQTVNPVEIPTATPTPAPTATITVDPEIKPEADFATATVPVVLVTPSETAPVEAPVATATEPVEANGETAVDTLSTTAPTVSAEEATATEPTAVSELTETQLNQTLVQQVTEGVDAVAELEKSLQVREDITKSAEQTTALLEVTSGETTSAEKEIVAISQESILIKLGIEDAEITLPELQTALKEAVVAADAKVDEAQAEVLNFIETTAPLVVEKIKRLESTETVPVVNEDNVEAVLEVAQALLETNKALTATVAAE